MSMHVLTLTLASLSKRRFSLHGRHPKIRITNFDGIKLHHSARARKQKALKVVYFVQGRTEAITLGGRGVYFPN
jgi:hypothetical protein